MRQPIRFFAIGLLLSAILLFVAFTLFDKSDENDTKAKPQTISVEDMIEKIQTEGYRVMKEEQYIALTLASDETSQTEADKEDITEEPDETGPEFENNEAENTDTEEDIKNHETFTHTFTTNDNVVSQNIADILLDNKIIDDRRAFLEYLEKNDHMRYIQVGKFTVNSDMTYEEIAKVITTYPGH